MGFSAYFSHIAGFLAPALALALIVPVLARVLFRGAQPLGRWPAQLAICLAVGAGAMLGGLWYFGRDGKMASYAALVLAVASAQWLMLRGWRR